MNIWKKTASLLLVICLVVGLLPTTVFAAGDTGKAIQLVTDSNPTGGISGYNSTNGYDYIYYGYWTAPDSYTTSGPIKWRVLDDKTNMDGAKEGDGLFLLSDALFGTGSNGGVSFDSNAYSSNAWQGSSAQSWCRDFAGIEGNSVTDAFSTAELAAILATTKSDGEYGSFSGSDNILAGDKVFFLSAEEADNSTYGFSGNTMRVANYGASAGLWWLRSPIDGYGWYAFTGMVDKNGDVSYNAAYSARTARPAFNLDLSSVLFTSAAENSGHNSSFSEPANYSGNEWKLTIADSNSFASASVTGGSTSLSFGYSAETLTISHASLSSLSTDYTNVTAMLTDSDGNILYYGSINSSTSAISSTVMIPEGLDVGTYTLSIYGEDWNDAKLTDYATGTPFTTSITVNKADQSVSYSESSVTKHVNDTVFTNVLTQTTVYGAISYTSGNTAVATVDESTGEVTIIGVGTATITATAASSDLCNEAAASYTLTVTDHSYIAEVVEPTYTDKGYTLHTCIYCDDSYKDDYTDVLTISEVDGTGTRLMTYELTTLPEGLTEIYSNVETLIEDLTSRVTVSEGYTKENVKVHDVVLQYLSADGTWVNATVDNFPADGITITLPYPEGTDSSYEFTVLHMFTETSSRLGITAGETESPTVTKTEEGLVVTVTGMSPIAISWKKDTATVTTTASNETVTASTETGDHTFLWLWGILALAGGLCIVYVTAYRRRKTEEKQ